MLGRAFRWFLQAIRDAVYLFLAPDRLERDPDPDDDRQTR